MAEIRNLIADANKRGSLETRVRRRARGALTVPAKIVEWLESLAAVHAAYPRPESSQAPGAGEVV